MGVIPGLAHFVAGSGGFPGWDVVAAVQSATNSVTCPADVRVGDVLIFVGGSWDGTATRGTFWTDDKSTLCLQDRNNGPSTMVLAGFKMGEVADSSTVKAIHTGASGSGSYAACIQLRPKGSGPKGIIAPRRPYNVSRSTGNPAATSAPGLGLKAPLVQLAFAMATTAIAGLSVTGPAGRTTLPTISTRFSLSYFSSLKGNVGADLVIDEGDGGDNAMFGLTLCDSGAEGLVTLDAAAMHAAGTGIFGGTAPTYSYDAVTNTLNFGTSASSTARFRGLAALASGAAYCVALRVKPSGGANPGSVTIDYQDGPAIALSGDVINSYWQWVVFTGTAGATAGGFLDWNMAATARSFLVSHMVQFPG